MNFLPSDKWTPAVSYENFIHYNVFGWKIFINPSWLSVGGRECEWRYGGINMVELRDCNLRVEFCRFPKLARIP